MKNELKIINKKTNIKNVNDINNQQNIKNIINDGLIKSLLKAIDNKNEIEIKILYNKSNYHNVNNNVVYEMYNENKLNCERLQFIIDNCTVYFNISSSLIKKLMKDNK